MKSADLGWEMHEQTVDTIFQGFDLIRTLLSKQAGSNDTPVDLSQFVDNVHARMNALEETRRREERERRLAQKPAIIACNGKQATALALAVTIHCLRPIRVIETHRETYKNGKICNSRMLR